MAITSSFVSTVVTSLPNARTLSLCLLEIHTKVGAGMNLSSPSCFLGTWPLASADTVILFPRQRPPLTLHCPFFVSSSSQDTSALSQKPPSWPAPSPPIKVFTKFFSRLHFSNYKCNSLQRKKKKNTQRKPKDENKYSL